MRQLATLLFSLGLVAASTVADAQTKVLLRTEYLEPTGCQVGGCRTSLIAIAPDAPAVIGKQTVPDGGGSYVTPDGAFMVWVDQSTPQALVLRSMVTGATTTVPLPGASALVGNPTRPEVYSNDSGGAIALSFDGVRRLGAPACANPGAAAVSSNGQRVVYTCYPGGGNPGYTAVLDTATGATVIALPFAWAPSLSPAGTDVYVVETVGADTRLRRYDIGTGSMLAEAVLGTGTYVTNVATTVDPVVGRVVVSGEFGSRIFDGATLVLLGTHGGSSSQWAFDPYQPRAYVSSSRSYEPFLHADSEFAIVETTAFSTLSSWRYTSRTGATSLVVAPLPAAPASLAAAVQGATVQLSWAPGASQATTLRYVVEAGIAPGLANITTFDVGLQTGLSVGGVPPGTYFVRVRAGNVTGLSAPSSDVIVTVP